MNEPPRDEFQPIVEDCQGCGKITENRCEAYINPAGWWKRGACPLATHNITRDSKVQNGKVRVGQQKQKKR
jgi:hypothetical protein